MILQLPLPFRASLSMSSVIRFIAALMLVLSSLSVANAQQFETLKILTAQGHTHAFQIEVAKSDQERMQGLMYRQSMPANQGMIFDYKTPQHVAMWMKNTYIPLDMLFIRADGVIARIATNTEPLSTRSISSGEPVLAVLELNGGLTARLGIHAGDRVEYSLFHK